MVRRRIEQRGRSDHVNSPSNPVAMEIERNRADNDLDDSMEPSRAAGRDRCRQDCQRAGSRALNTRVTSIRAAGEIDDPA
jgi:hypothetical protein